MVIFPLKMVIFNSYVSLPEGTCSLQEMDHLRSLGPRHRYRPDPSCRGTWAEDAFRTVEPPVQKGLQ